MNDKQKIILYYIKDNMSQREIHRLTGIARNTIRKYIEEYESKLQKLAYESSDIEKYRLAALKRKDSSYVEFTDTFIFPKRKETEE